MSPGLCYNSEVGLHHTRDGLTSGNLMECVRNTPCAAEQQVVAQDMEDCFLHR